VVGVSITPGVARVGAGDDVRAGRLLEDVTARSGASCCARNSTLCSPRSSTPGANCGNLQRRRVLVGSTAGLTGSLTNGRRGAYGHQGRVIALTRQLAAEGARDGIRHQPRTTHDRSVGRVRSVTIVGVCVALTACGGGLEVNSDAPSSISVTSSAFAPNAPIPEKYSCHGDNVSPPLAWSGVPGDAAELALVMDDPDAPRGTFTHWILFGLPASMTSLDEATIPDDARQARNSAGDARYFGPCPPSGTHHYRFTIYALDDSLDLAAGAGTTEALTAIADHAMGQGRLVGTFAAR
jgi:Raf kinase inhibitor-like YbhB/YbcL family protein